MTAEGQEFILTGGYHNNDPTFRWVAAEPEVPEDLRKQLTSAMANCAVAASNEYRTTFDFEQVEPSASCEGLQKYVASVLRDAGHTAVQRVVRNGIVVNVPLQRNRSAWFNIREQVRGIFRHT